MTSSNEILNLIFSLDDCITQANTKINKVGKKTVRNKKSKEQLNDDNIYDAVNLWFDNPRLCKWRYGHISTWNVTNVTSMRDLFKFRPRFNENISNWDVSNVNDMSCMFSFCANFNQPLDKWNVSNVETMDWMFCSCVKFNHPLNNWNVSKVTDMRGLFADCEKLENLPEWYKPM